MTSNQHVVAHFPDCSDHGARFPIADELPDKHWSGGACAAQDPLENVLWMCRRLWRVSKFVNLSHLSGSARRFAGFESRGAASDGADRIDAGLRDGTGLQVRSKKLLLSRCGEKLPDFA